MATGYTEVNLMHIDFTDATWVDAFPHIYSFVNTASVPWKVDTTFQYETQPTLRSGAIGHSGSTTITLNFTLVEAGSITFPYCITSESRHDWLTVVVDGTQRVRVAGSYAWTVYTEQLAAGDHVVTFTYSKDSSVSTGVDATAIGYIDLLGVVANYSSYYLVHDLAASKYYANIDGSLTEVALQEAPTRQDFVTYGGLIPTPGMLDQLTTFELLKCADSIERPETMSGIKFSIVGNVRPQLLKCTKPTAITEQYQTGFKSVSLALTKLDTTVVKVLLSYDDVTWYRYTTASSDGTTPAAWSEVAFTTEDALANGMTLAELALVDADAFALLYTDGIKKILHVAFVIQSTALDHWTISSLRVEFTTTK